MGALCLSLFYYVLICVYVRFAIFLKKKRKLVALLLLSYRYVLWLFLTVPWVCLQCVIVEYPDHTHLPILTLVQLKKLHLMDLS